MILNFFANKNDLSFEDVKYGNMCKFKLKGRTFIFLKPNTYMNLSGKSVKYWLSKENISIENATYLQNLENTKKQNEELEIEIQKAEEKYNSMNESLKSKQEKFAVLRENKARFEATVEGIDQRKMDLNFFILRKCL